ncbi:Gfo/Idh/MocA family protein [Candidatus Laterigemmans baculatus]|uniref:Gfo/Idh/MocA family protein n=1 Tax=Candidatus Laterigemmans baculatus TaxID=2770505 RepID=UPI0013DBA608|nr:Gfo/Idh/MocA family oxidoreductase [Candidatus Laterigemmans baculatus]
MSIDRDRRLFLQSGVAAAAALAAGRAQAAPQQAAAKDSPGEKIVVGMMGVNSRGKALTKGFLAAPNVEIAYVCDVDSRAVEAAGAMVEKSQGRKPQLTGDFRRILDDQAVDALVVAAPNHWHAPATILGCAAGKHVYVEKPCSQTPEEGELAVAAARKNKRIVQMGSQRRSWPAIQEAVKKIQDGEIGRVLYSRTWYNNRRPSIGFGQEVAAPEWLDWDLWQGPAPRTAFRDNLVHYNWHWHWHWGNGEMGNNGIHALDVARWGMGVTFPERVTAGGGKYRHDDDQQTPDTMMVTYDFPEQKTITWEGLSWSPLGPHDSRFGISFHGTDGSIVIRNADYTMYDMQGKQVGETHSDRGGDTDHLADFFNSIRTGKLPNADIEEAHRSTLLCHLGNIAYRTGGVVDIDPSNGHILNNSEAQAHWGREYEKGWEPKV